jgi:hypothetical protein
VIGVTLKGHFITANANNTLNDANGDTGFVQNAALFNV